MRVNWPIVAIGVMWWAMETHHFGWNSRPSSVAELFADGVALAFFAAACAFPPRRASVVIQNHSTTPEDADDAI